jgi:hypothetical protein
MPTDKVALDELRRDNQRRLAEIRRRLRALEIAALKQRIKALEDRGDAKRAQSRA